MDELAPPDFLPLLDARHLEQHVCADATLESRVEVDCEICRKDHNAIERLKLPQQHIHNGVRFALISLRSAVDRRDAIASASSKNSTASCSAAMLKTAATFFGVSPAHIDSISA